MIEKGMMTSITQSAPVSASPRVHGEHLAPYGDLWDRFIAPQQFPEVLWLTRARFRAPGRNLKELSFSTRLAKRSLDVVGAVTLLILLSPVMLLVAILVKLTSPGPILYKQVRVGLNLRSKARDRRQLNLGPPSGVERRAARADRRQKPAYGREFVLYKFRTMRVDAETNGPQWATPNDPRVTPLGRFLRKTRLDELPQLWNVLRGDMSLVGPRPERPEFCRQLCQEIPYYLDRLGLRPGLTGLAQILNGYDTNLDSVKRKVALDLLYLQNCSLINDLKIMLRTISVVIKGSGAH